MLKAFWDKVKCSVSSSGNPERVHSGKPGSDGDIPPTEYVVSKLNATVLAAHTGPENGIFDFRACVPDLAVDSWDKAEDWACGHATSLYDASPTTGVRSGDPVADCFALLAYPTGATLVLADGVNWGEPARRAARCAVLAGIAHLHKGLGALASSDGSSNGNNNQPPPQQQQQPAPAAPVTTTDLFKLLVASTGPAHKLILQQCGTLTTYVACMVVRCKGGRWAALCLTVGDSSAYVWRAKERCVQELTRAAQGEAFRDPRWTPGALGYAMGDDPDLSNMCLSLTTLKEGDIVFCTSDGVSDNFDPIMLKTACMAPYAVMQHAAHTAGEAEGDEGGDELPALTVSQAHDAAVSSIARVIAEGGGSSSAGATARSVVDGLISHVYEATEEARGAAVDRAARKAAERRDPLSRERRSLATDGNTSAGISLGGGVGGKMDHATVVAYQVGDRRGKLKAAKH